MKKYLLPLLVLAVLYLLFIRKANAAPVEGTVKTPIGDGFANANMLPPLPSFTTSYPGDSASRNPAGDLSTGPTIPPCTGNCWVPWKG